MDRYYVEAKPEGVRTLYRIRRIRDKKPVSEANRYLRHKVRENCSPNTVRRYAFSLSYYLGYLDEQQMTVSDVFRLPFDRQQIHFTEFLSWVKKGKHAGSSGSAPANATCNAYLQDVFGWYQFLEEQAEQHPDLKVLSSRVVAYTNSTGLRFRVVRRAFKGYLPEDDQIGRTIEQDQILTLLLHCTNVRDQLLLLLLAETGFRIGEMLGVVYTRDIRFDERLLYVHFRENQNGARAKNAEYRHAKISQETFDVLLYYLSEYRDLLKKTEYLFVVLTGKDAGKPMKVSTVYAMLRRLEAKTGILVTPHMLRHYFANERRREGWDLFLISKALGHRQIATTERYLDIGSDELVEASEKYYQKYKGLIGADQVR